MNNFIVNLYIKIFAFTFGATLSAGGVYSKFINNNPIDKTVPFIVIGIIFMIISLYSIHQDIKKL